MNAERILDAVVEAQTFIDRARELVEARKRRASMDLTRALAEMRRAK